LLNVPPIRGWCAEKSVHCEIDREGKVGEVKCNLCGAQYSSTINDLSEPIDIYR
jgi:transcription elongation factor Elf1